MNSIKISLSRLFAHRLRSNRFISNNISLVYNKMFKEHFSVCFPDKTVHFMKLNDGDAQSNLTVQNIPISEALPEVSWSTEFLKNVNKICIIFSSKFDIFHSEQHSYIQSCLDLNEIFRSSKNNPTFCLGYTNVRLDQKDRNVYGGRYSRILCAFFSSEVDIQKLNLNAVDCHNIEIFKLNVYGEESGVISLTAVDSSNVEAGSSFWKLDGSINAAILKSVCDKEELSPVYHEVETALDVLNKYKNIPEVEEVINIYKKEKEKTKQTETQKFPFIVIEGLDAAGKSTLTETLVNKLGAVKYCTPPPVIQHLRKYFVSLPEILARAYYQLGNYIVAQDIIEECQQRPVIMDRYWHSTAAYGIANESSLADLPEKGHPIYNWPSTLLKPSLVLFLSVTESTRQQRMTGRAGEMTFEERALDKDLFFRKRLYKSYKRMSNPCCIEIDANGSVESVQEKAIAVLKEHNIHL